MNRDEDSVEVTAHSQRDRMNDTTLIVPIPNTDPSYVGLPGFSLCLNPVCAPYLSSFPPSHLPDNTDFPSQRVTETNNLERKILIQVKKKYIKTYAQLPQAAY